MKILFLSHYFPPEVNAPATRTYEHCKQWVKDGHEVTVISCVPHHPMGKAYPGYRNKFYQVEYKDGIKAVKVWTYITANEGFLKRTFNYVFYMVMAVVVAPFVGKADVVISTSPQFFNGLAGFVVSGLKRCPWVLEIRDLWPESILAVGAIKNKRIIAALEWLERFAYRKADYIVPVTHAFQKHIEAHGGNSEKITVIRNGVDLNFFAHRPYDDKLAEELGVKGKFVASYVGTHGMAHGLDILLDAAESLKNLEDIVFLTAGAGADLARLRSERERRGLFNLIILGQLPKEQMPAIWSISDVSLVLLKKLDLFTTVIPSKIFETMAMQKPIILAVRGESQEIVEKAGVGICIEPENAMQLAAAVTTLADSPDRCRALGEAGLACVSEEFDRKVLAQRFEEVLRKSAEK